MYLIRWTKITADLFPDSEEKPRKMEKKVETFQEREDLLLELTNNEKVEEIEVWDKLEHFERAGEHKDYWLRTISWRFLREIVTPLKRVLRTVELEEKRRRGK